MIRELIKKWAPKFTNQKPDLKIISLQCALRLVEGHPRKFKGAIVWGEKRVGKSIYALKVAMQIFISLDCTDEEAWELALASLFFHPQEFLENLKYLNNNGFV